eukprot:4390099-Pleurochrysis_carterae.AAC.1
MSQKTAHEGPVRCDGLPIVLVSEACKEACFAVAKALVSELSLCRCRNTLCLVADAQLASLVAGSCYLTRTSRAQRGGSCTFACGRYGSSAVLQARVEFDASYCETIGANAPGPHCVERASGLREVAPSHEKWNGIAHPPSRK